MPSPDPRQIEWDEEATVPVAGPEVPPPTIEWDEAAADAAPQVAASGTIARGVSNTFGLGDERDGAIGAWIEGINRLREGEFPGWKDPAATARILGDAYVSSRDRTRRLQDADNEQRPGLSIASNVAGNLVTGPVGGLRSLMAQGALSGFGNSRSETVGGMMLDSGVGAGLSGIVGKGLQGAGNLVTRVADKAKSKLGAAVLDSANRAAEEGKDVVASAGGELGAKVQSGNRYLENVMRLLTAPELDPAEQQALAALKQEPWYPQLLGELAQSMREKLPGQVNEINSARLVYETVKKNLPKYVAERADEIMSPAEAARQLGARAKRYLPPLAGTVLGPVAGGAAGLATGEGLTAAAGGLAGAGARPAIHALGRMMNHPSVVNLTWGTVQKVVAAPAKYGTYGGILANAAARGPEALRATLHVAQTSIPGFREWWERTQKEDAEAARDAGASAPSGE